MNTPRFTGNVARENTERALKRSFLAPVYAATIALLINQTVAHTLVQPAALTGAATVTANVDTPYVGDELELLLVSDATSRTVTFGTGFASAGTLAVTTAKYAHIKFIFNGTVWQEVSRTVTA